MEGECGKALCKSQQTALHSDTSQLILGWSDVEADVPLPEEDWEVNMAADEQAKEGCKEERTTTTDDERVCA